MRKFSMVAMLAVSAMLFATLDVSACGRRKAFSGCQQATARPAASCGVQYAAPVQQAAYAAPAANAAPACSGNSCSQSAGGSGAVIPIGNKGGLFGFGILGR